MCEFLLGTHRPHWIYPGKRESRPLGPLFISVRQLMERRKTAYPIADTPFAADSAGFTEIHKNGGYSITAQTYARFIERVSVETTTLLWAAIQDYMCETSALRATGLSVAEHQTRTVRSYLELRDLAPGISWVPVLQGREVGDYLRHVDEYGAAGVDLTSLPLVGLGSVCRRQAEREIVTLSSTLARAGIRLHGFGIKIQGLALSAENFVSTDSLAWSLHEFRHRTGRASSIHAAEEYRAKVQVVIDKRLWQLSETLKA